VDIDLLAEFIAESPAMASVGETLRRLLVGQAQAPRPASVLLLGETGVGKSLVARVLHRAGPRANGPFVDVNCAAIPDHLLEAELFGYERGAFTDAKHAKPGLLQAASGGTLFLDEIGLLPAESQAKLLTVLEEGRVRRLGATRGEPVDVSIVAATSEDLESAARKRAFRSDLYHRLAVITVRLPALRERPEDILPLAERFLREASAGTARPPKTLTADARATLLAYDWPGNIRELRNVITRAVLLTEASELSPAALQLPPSSTTAKGRATPARADEAAEAKPGAAGDIGPERIAQVLRDTGWNVSRAAARLGLSRSQLRYRVDKLGLAPASPAEPTARIIDPGAAPVGLSTVLPLPVTSLIGRERELRDIERLLDAHRVVTLLGTGGVGKTRLALTAGAQLRERYPDGVWFVELATVPDAGLVAQAVASALGLQEEASRPPRELLAAALARRQALLILDNCEHVVEACAELVEALLRACPPLGVLTTSRERLNIPGESTFQVPSLALPDEHERAPERLARSEAVRLFVERARLVAPDFALTAENAPSVAELCRRLDGLPLAIELAAARVRLLRVEQIVARLNDRFGLLTGGSRTTLPRQQTLRAALDWSHDLLSKPEQTLLRRLSVFAGGFTLEAVEGVCAGPEVDVSQALDLLGQLVDKSMVLVETAEPGAPVARYRLLESIREYCHQRARMAGEVAWLRRRHQAWFLALAEEAERRSRGPEQIAWLDRLETEYDNLQTALSWRDQDRASDVLRLRLGAALWRFWEVRGGLREGLKWLGAILADAGYDAPAERARALNGAGNLARDVGDYRSAAQHHTEALRLRRQIGDPRDVARSLNNLGVIAHDQARYAEAEVFFSEAIPAWRAAGDHEGLGLTLNNLGRTRRFQGDFERGVVLGEEALALFRAIDHAWGTAQELNNLANAAHYQGDVAGARPMYEESLRLRRLVGDRRGMGVALNGLALLHGVTGELEVARQLAEEALALRRDLGDRRGIGASLFALGCVALWGGDLDRAEHLARESLGIRSDLADRLGIACCLELLGEAAFGRAQPARAAPLLRAAAVERAAINAPLPPLDRERVERIMAALAIHRDQETGAAAVSAVVAEELRAHLPGPKVESLGRGA
jgi:DNA-binding NtrC family response regulator/predicted ATPase